MSDSFDDGSGIATGSDSFTETSTQGWGSRLGSSLIAALIGLLLVPAAIALLYWNEGRAVDALRALDRGAAAIAEVTSTGSTRRRTAVWWICRELCRPPSQPGIRCSE